MVNHCDRIHVHVVQGGGKRDQGKKGKAKDTSKDRVSCAEQPNDCE